jgi:hypothetical protein
MSALPADLAVPAADTIADSTARYFHEISRIPHGNHSELAEGEGPFAVTFIDSRLTRRGKARYVMIAPLTRRSRSQRMHKIIRVRGAPSGDGVPPWTGLVAAVAAAGHVME